MYIHVIKLNVMKKVLTIITVLFALNCSAAPEVKFPIFGKKKDRIRCGGKVSHKYGKETSPSSQALAELSQLMASAPVEVARKAQEAMIAKQQGVQTQTGVIGDFLAKSAQLGVSLSELGKANSSPTNPRTFSFYSL